MQTKGMMRYYYAPTRMDSIERTDNTKYGQDMEKLEPVKWYNHFRKWFGSFLKKGKHELTMTQPFHS